MAEYTEVTLSDWRNVPMNERCPVCGQPDNCGDCDHTEVLAFVGTCQSCGRYLDVRQHDRCPSPCHGYIG